MQGNQSPTWYTLYINNRISTSLRSSERSLIQPMPPRVVVVKVDSPSNGQTNKVHNSEDLVPHNQEFRKKMIYTVIENK